MMLAELGTNSLNIFPKTALLIFFAVFVAVSIRALRYSRSEMQACSRMPLDETTPGVDDTNHELGDVR